MIVMNKSSKIKHKVTSNLIRPSSESAIFEEMAPVLVNR